jgi:hypothetical protein
MGHQNALKQRGRSSSEAFLSGDLKPGSRERLGSWRSLTIGALGWPTIFKDRPARSFELVLSVPPTAMLSAFSVWKGWLRLTMPAVWSRLFLVQYVHQGGVGSVEKPKTLRYFILMRAHATATAEARLAFTEDDLAYLPDHVGLWIMSDRFSK